MGQAEHFFSSGSAKEKDSETSTPALSLFKEHSLRINKHDVSVTILQLSRFIQRHRGAVLAMLGGDESFISQVQTLQNQIAVQYEYLQYLNNGEAKVLSEDEYQQLKLGWMTIIQDWRNDDLHQSFEFHSHLLESIARTSRQLTESVLSLTTANPTLQSRIENTYLHPLDNLSKTGVIELYELVEYLARIRGLGTHMAAMGKINQEWESRVSFWLQEFRYRKERFDQNVQLVPRSYTPCIPGLLALPGLNTKLNYFLNLLGHEMSSERSFQIPSHKLFLMGTEIIDGYLAIMDQANAVIRDQLYHMNQLCLEHSVKE